LEEGGVKTTPESVDIDNDGFPEILISSGTAVRPDRDTVDPETTYVCKWNRKSYDLIRTVPWEQRFDVLKPQK
jgi:hypothetical protein